MDKTAPYAWQQAKLKDLITQMQADRLPHALLFYGSPGIGKAAFARRFANRLLCASQTTLPCGQCQNCRLFLTGAHPDYHELKPEKAGASIKIEQVRDLIAPIAQTAQMSGNKVVVIDPAHRLFRSAANALLKMLEEPPGNTYFLLVTEHPARLLPTIQSRVQRCFLPAPTAVDARNYLEPFATEYPLCTALFASAPLMLERLATDDQLQSIESAVSFLLSANLQSVTPERISKQFSGISPIAFCDLMLRLLHQLLVVYATDAADFQLGRTHTLPVRTKQPLAVLALIDKLFFFSRQFQANIALNTALLFETVCYKWLELKHTDRELFEGNN